MGWQNSTAYGLSTTPAADWRHRAACRDEDPELFFPIGDDSASVWQIEDAKQVCAGCPVRQQCLDQALAAGERYGIWGGLAPFERREMKHRRTVTA